MFTHLLVPLDGSRLAEVVLDDAQALAAQLGARMTLLHITERKPPATVHGEPHLTSTPKAEEYLATLAARLSSARRDVAWHVHAADERGVAQMIVDQALELHADLIVLGTHGSGGLREALLGSIAQRVVHEGRVPVLLAHPARVLASAPALAIRQILVPLDGEPAHEIAIPAALAMARAWGATVHLLNVVPTLETLSGQEATPGTVLPTTMRAVLDLSQEGGAEYLQGVRQRLVGEAVPATAQVLRGDPAKAIVAEADTIHADLIVMATHGRTGLDAFWSASVAPKVLRDAHAPLLLLRAPSD